MTSVDNEVFQYKDQTGEIIHLTPGKVVCVGRNYAEHAKELGNTVPGTPLLFIKPATAVVDLEPGFKMPVTLSGIGAACHFETEISVLIGHRLISSLRGGGQHSTAAIENAIAGYGLALDLTFRELQNQLKAKGHPWEIAKGFDGACPMGRFYTGKVKPDDLGLQCTINGEVRQYGFAGEMMLGIVDLIKLITQHFTLEPGDVVLSGTPAGVGPLVQGDRFQLNLLARDKASQQGVVSALLKYNSRVVN